MMKKTARFYFFLVLLLSAFACRKEAMVENVAGTELEVGLPSGKTGISEPSEGTRTAFWKEGDELLLNGVSSTPLGSEAEGCSVARFQWDAVLEAPYKLLYPASFYKDDSHIVLPFSQNKMPGENDIATETYPMYACSATTPSGVHMEYLCTILSVKWYMGGSGDTDNISYVEFRGNNGEQVSGVFTLDYATGDFTPAGSGELSKTVRAFSIKASESEEDVKVCNIVVPAGTYSKGFTIRLVDDKGHYMDKTTSSARTFAPGEVRAFPAFEFVPETEQLDALCIKTAEELIAFARDWNANRFEGGKANVYLASDIVFDEATSAEFVRAGGIGCKLPDADVYYNGVFSGNGFKIKNLVSTVPLFGYTGASAVISGVVLDSSCSFTCPSDAATTDFGPLVGRCKGLVTDCVSSATVTVETNTSAVGRFIGGLTGRLYEGTLENCSFDGTIVMGSGNQTAKTIAIGGLSGGLDGENVSRMAIRGCTMDGAITLSDGTTYGGPVLTGEYLYVGGIVGDMSDGTVENCTTTESALIDCRGQYKNGIGGIVGYVNTGSVSSCENSATVTFASNGARANTTPTYVGGILGQSYSKGVTTMDDCHNHGALTTTSNSTTLSIGGVAGFFNGTLSNSTNSGAVTRNSQTSAGQANRYISVGGVIGTLYSGTISFCDNGGAVLSNFPGTATQTTVACGGVVAQVKGGTTAVIENCTNSGTVKEAGGDDVTIMSYHTIGGIAGVVSMPTSVSGCTNNAALQLSYNTKASRGGHTGGIVGTVAIYDSAWKAAENVSISDCVNYGKAYNQVFSNSYVLPTAGICGGIVGMAMGTVSSPVSISGCRNDNSISSSSPCAIKRGFEGGIIGYADHCAIESCVSRKDTEVASNNIPRYCGGIAGQLLASSVSGCDADRVHLYGSSSAACDMGGIVGSMDATSSVDGCNVISIGLAYNAVSANFKYGAIAGTTESASVIRNCKISGGWSTDTGANYTPFIIDNITSGTAFTGSGNTVDTSVYDLVGTVKCGTTPLPGVVVSDGYQSVVTDADGKYRMHTSAGATCVSVSIPSGYMPAVSGGLAAFYKKLSTVSASGGVKTVNFALNAIASNPDKYTVIAYADIQIRSSSLGYDNVAFHSIDVGKDIFTDIAEYASGVSGSNVIGLSLGDQVHKDMSLWSTYKGSSMLGKLDFPNFCTIGNHDYDVNATDYITGAKYYEENVAPVRYSFNMGKFHVIVMDNTRTIKNPSGEGEVSETKGLPDPAWEWLQGDLKYVPTSTPIIVCTHAPLFMEIYSTDKRERDMSTRDWALNTGYGPLLAKYSKVIALNGHTHVSYNYVYPSSSAKKNVVVHGLARSAGQLWTNQFISSCGTPRGYVVFDIDGTDVRYKFKPVAYQSGTLAAGPSPMTYYDYSTSSSVFRMKSGKTHAGERLDDFYQIHAYAPGASSQIPDKILATVFMYNRLWSNVTLEYEGGSVTMEQIPVTEGIHEPANTWITEWYKANSLLASEDGYDNEHCCYNLFRCDPPAGVNAGTVKVTDEFGETYTYPLKW